MHLRGEKRPADGLYQVETSRIKKCALQSCVSILNNTRCWTFFNKNSSYGKRLFTKWLCSKLPLISKQFTFHLLQLVITPETEVSRSQNCSIFKSITRDSR